MRRLQVTVQAVLFSVFAARAVLVGATEISTVDEKGKPARLFRAGAAASNVTPPLGLPIVGGWLPRPATHIHDELYAKCIVLDDGETRLA
ncbi:MAG: hypothetical protein ACYSUI_25415, partial [Planctomycetota bacterium]